MIFILVIKKFKLNVFTLIKDLTNKKNINLKKPLALNLSQLPFLGSTFGDCAHSLSALSESSQLRITLPTVGQRIFKPRVII